MLRNNVFWSDSFFIKYEIPILIHKQRNWFVHEIFSGQRWFKQSMSKQWHKISKFIDIKNDFSFILNDKNQTASLLSLLTKKDDLIILRAVIFESNEFLVKK